MYTQRRTSVRLLLLSLCASLLGALCVSCDTSPPVKVRDQQVDYREGTVDDNYTNNGERGNILISEIHWSGSVRTNPDGTRTYDSQDIFIEFQNKHPRPIHMTGWQLIIDGGVIRPGINQAVPRNNRPRTTYTIPLRENRLPVQPNEIVTLAVKRDGAFREADYYIEDMRLPRDSFSINLRDIDDRLIGNAGSREREPFAGAYDGITSRSMERIQLIFANQGGRESSWHTYTIHPWDPLHEGFAAKIHPDYRKLTLASPGFANSPDYSGNTSAGDFQ